MSYCELGWWGSERGRNRVQISFCWAEGPDGWEKEYTPVGSFFNIFSALDDYSKSGSSLGPTVSSVLGDIESLAFDDERNTYGKVNRECIGFSHLWDPRRVFGQRWYGKYLSIYACGNDDRSMTEGMFLHILTGVSIEGEFEALVE